MQLESEFDRKKVKALLCGSHLHFSIITVWLSHVTAVWNLQGLYPCFST